MPPALLAGAQFAHRSNRNGTTDTICRHCLATVATATWEAELDRAESTHACDPRLLQLLKRPARPEALALLTPRRAHT